MLAFVSDASKASINKNAIYAKEKEKTTNFRGNSRELLVAKMINNRLYVT